MKSKALYLFVVGALVICLFGGAEALAQPEIVIDSGTIVCKEDTAGTIINGIIDEATDSLIVTVWAALPNDGTYPLCVEDSVEAGLWPTPGLGEFSPSVPQITYLCNPVQLYQMNVTLSPGGLSGTASDSCLATCVLTFHPMNLVASSGTIAQFSVTVKSAADCWPCRYCRSDPLYVELPCSVNTVTGCGTLLWSERYGFIGDNITAIGDTLWWDFQGDTAVGDTFWIDLSCVTGNAADAYTFPGRSHYVIVQATDLLENGLTDTFWVQKAYLTGPNWPADTSWLRDTCYVLREIDNTPPVVYDCCIDSCSIISGNWIPNDTTGWWPNLGSPWWPYAGIGDTLRIFWSNSRDDTCPAIPLQTQVCAGETLTYCNGKRMPQNFDGAWVGFSSELFLKTYGAGPPYVWPVNNVPGGTSPYPGPGTRLIPAGPPQASDSIWIGNGHWSKGLYVDVPIDTTNWSFIQMCLRNASYPAVPRLYAYDDAGNQSNMHLYECDFCIDNICPPALSDIYQDTVCRRFSPTDTSGWEWWNISPDSIRIWLDDLDNASNSLDDSLDQLFLVGIDVRSEPDEITGNIVAVLDYFNPLLNPIYIPTDRDTWLFPWGPYDKGAFDWYGKQGTDSLDPWLDLNGTCPLGFNVGFTLARFMDRAGNSCIRGWDNDTTTTLPEYTQRNRIHAVVDTCIPGVVELADTLTVNNIALGSGPPTPPIAPEPGYQTYKWIAGMTDPVLQFRPKRFYNQGDGIDADSCMMEKLFYQVLCERVVTYGVWPNPDDTAGFYAGSDPTDGDANWIWDPIAFNANDVNGPVITFQWGHEFPSTSPLNDGLYRLELQLLDDAGMIYYDPVYIWLNGQGPAIDTASVTDPDTNCTLHFFVDDTLCVTVITDTSAQYVQLDWTCIFSQLYGHIDTSAANVENVSYDSTHIGGDSCIWMICINGILADYIDTTDADRNNYELDTMEVDCQNSCGNYIIGVTAWDSDGLMSKYDQVCGTGVCQEAILGLTPCPRLATTPQFFFYNPDSIAADSAANLGFPWGPEPLWNAISPGNLDHAYSASLNWAQDNMQDTVFVRVLIDSLTINPAGGDSIELVFTNSNASPTRQRVVRRPLFPVTPTTDALPNNTVYYGRLTNLWIDATTPSPYYQFIYMWNGTWFVSGGMDSIELVDFDKQDTVLVSIAAIDSDATLACDTVFADLDVDNINPEFKDWTGIAPGTRDNNTGSTPSVWNLGVDNDCGFRFAEGDTFRLKVKLSEDVHFDSSAYPNDAGSWRDPITGDWLVTRNWQVSAIDVATQDLVIIGSDTVKVWLDSVTESFSPADSFYYILQGHFENIPDNYCNTNVLLLIRAAWDQAGNPGRYNNPVFTDAYEEDSCEDTTFAVYIVNINPFIIGCPMVWGPDSIIGWIAPEDTHIVVKAPIIETTELWACDSTKVDSIHIVEGAFQMITGDPNPWIHPDSVGDWYLWADAMVCDSLEFWARDYFWYIRADSSNLATVHCDGDSLDFFIRFWTFADHHDSGAFNCVQVDVNEPRWDSLGVYNPGGGGILPLVPPDSCISPRDTLLLIGLFSDDFVDCPNGNGIGVVDTLIWADLSDITGNPGDTMVVPDTVVPFFGYYLATWDTVIPDSHWYCLDTAHAVWTAYALTDSIGHYDRELFATDTICFTDDCLPPELVSAAAYCEDHPLLPIWAHRGWLSPGTRIRISGTFRDADSDSSLGLDSVWCDPGELTGFPGWLPADYEIDWTFNWKTAFWGLDGTFLYLNEPFNNLDTAYVWFKARDNYGNVDSFHVAVAIIDTLPPIVDDIYIVGDDSIPGYVTPGDDHVTIYSDMIPGDMYMASGPYKVWADLSRFKCDSTERADYDTVWADLSVETSPGHYRSYWGYDSLFYADMGYPGITSNFLSVCDTICDMAHLGAEGHYDTLWVFVTDSACNHADYYKKYEYSGCDSTVPAVDSVWIITNRCDTTVGFISSAPLDSFNIEVWAWMDTMFNGYEDTLRIDSLQSDLSGLNPTLYGWTQWQMPGAFGGWPVYGAADQPGHGDAYWDLMLDGQGRTRLVAKWVNLTAENLGCEDEVIVPVKGIRQTGVPGSHGYYMDIEYGHAWADTTRPFIYDMHVYNSTVSPNETTWVSPNYPVYVEICAMDTVCRWDYGNIGGLDLALGDPIDGPFISFCPGDNALRDLWTWDTTNFVVVDYDLINGNFWACLRWTGMPKYPDTCNVIDYDDLAGCVTAHIQDCLSNPAYPRTMQDMTDDRPPEYVLSAVRGDYTWETGFPGDPDHNHIDSVLVLRRGVYDLDYDSLLTAYVVVDNWPGDTLLSYNKTWIDFRHPTNHPARTFMNSGPDTMAHPDVIFYNVDGHHQDSIVWYVPLYNGGGPLFDVSILSDKYYFALQLSDTFGNSTGDGDSAWTTLFCDDLDSTIVFTIQNWNVPNPGMVLLEDSMDTWNNEKLSPDSAENLYKVWQSAEFRWYSNSTRFFLFVEDTVLQHDLIDNDADGLVDELGEGVDFYTADLRINNYPQVAHVDSMNSGGVWINYLWFQDNFSEGQYEVELFISDIYGHRDTLTLPTYGDSLALLFYEDESCPTGVAMALAEGGMSVPIRFHGTDMSPLDLTAVTGYDSLFVYNSFDSINVLLTDGYIFNSIPSVPGSGVDTDTSTVPDSTNWNNGAATIIQLLDPTGTPVPGFVQRYYSDLSHIPWATLVDPTGTIMAGMPDGIYTVEIYALDRMGNGCTWDWPFILDRTCPSIDSLFITQSGYNEVEDTLYASWDYVEIKSFVNDALDGVDSVVFDYCFDANRDGVLDAYPFWVQANILSVPNSGTDTNYVWAAYWSVMNLPWTSEDTLGMPPVDTLGRCINRYFVRVRAWDSFGAMCERYIPVDVVDDIPPLAYIVWPAQGSTFSTQIDSELVVTAYDSVGGTYDPTPGDTFTFSPLGRWFDLAKGMFQYKYFEAPGIYTPGNDDPGAGWVTIRTGFTPDSLGQDTVTYRAPDDSFHVRLNISNWLAHQYNMRFWTFDVCGNNDELNTPVVTFWVYQDTVNPIASITWPDEDMWVTDLHCSTGFVPIMATVPYYYDVDSVEFWYVDSLSIPGVGQHIYIGSVTVPDSVQPQWATYFSIRAWDTRHLLSGYYWLYARAWDAQHNFDPNPHWSRVMVDNTPPQVTSCWIGWDGPDYPMTTVTEGEWFPLKATAQDSIVDQWGVTHYGGIRWVQFQVLNRYGVWEDLAPHSDYNPLYGADIGVYVDYPYQYGVSRDSVAHNGEYECWVYFDNFGNSPLDSIRFRAYCADATDLSWPDLPESAQYWGNPNIEEDRNRDCNLDRDAELCSESIEIRDMYPTGVMLWAYNHSDFDNDLPVFGDPIFDYDRFGCNDPYALDTVLFVAKYDTLPGDQWLMHFVYWYSATWDTNGYIYWDSMEVARYIPNDITLNPSAPALGPVPLIAAWDSVYVIWTNIRQAIADTAAAHGFTNANLTFAAFMTDWTGNPSAIYDTSYINITWDCQAPFCEVTEPYDGQLLYASNGNCDTYTPLEAYVNKYLPANWELNLPNGDLIRDLYSTHWYWSYVGGPHWDTGMVDYTGCWPDPFGWDRDSTDNYYDSYYDANNTKWNNTVFRTFEGYKAGEGQVWVYVTDDVGNTGHCLVDVNVDNEAPNAPITHVSYVQNDPQNPEHRVRVLEAVPWEDTIPDTIEVLYNRNISPGGDDPEAFVIFYCNADDVLTCSGLPADVHNIQLWDLERNMAVGYGYICPGGDASRFDRFAMAREFDQYPPDDDANNRYEIALLLDNTYVPGTYHFAFIAQDDLGNLEGDSNMDDSIETYGVDTTKIDLWVRVVNVNEPEVVIRTPDYGHTCVHGTVPLGAEDVSDPDYFTGVIDTVYFHTETETHADTVLGYDTNQSYAFVTFELYESEVPGMAGWYVANGYQWYPERDLFPDVWVRILNANGSEYYTYDMVKSGGRWTATMNLPYNPTGYKYFFIIDANDNNEIDPNGTDRWVNDPRYTCTGSDTAWVHVWDYMINLDTHTLSNRSHDFWTTVVWHDNQGYHVIENPTMGDSIHVFFVDNEAAEGTHDIEFDVTRVAAGMLAPGEGGVCNAADTVHFVTDIQAINGYYNLPVEDICKVIYQRSYTDSAEYGSDNGWENVFTVYSNNDSGWTEAWPGWWVAVNPLTDNIDNDGDGLIDETSDVQAGDGVGEENVRIWTRSVIVDQCGNTYYTVADSLWLDVSEAQACITEVEGISPANNQTIIIPTDHKIDVIATDNSAPFDPAILARFQYRTLYPPSAWTNMQPLMGSGLNSVVRHVGNTFTFIWDLDSLFALPGHPDPENWYQLRAMAEDTVHNNDSCDHVICQITIRLNDITPAARIALYMVSSSTDTANSCTEDDIYYINPNPPYCVKAIFAATTIDTGLASLTFQYRTRDWTGDDSYTVSEWRNIETIYDHLDHGTAGDTTVCVSFQPRPEDVGQQGFDLRAIVEDYNGNDTSDVWTLWVDDTPLLQAADDIPTAHYDILHEGCTIVNDDALLTVDFDPDPVSGEVNVEEAWLTVTTADGTPTTYNLGYLDREDIDTWTFDFNDDICYMFTHSAAGSGRYLFDIHTIDCAGNEGARRVEVTCGAGDWTYTTDMLTVDCVSPVCGDLTRTDACTSMVANGGQTVHLLWNVTELTQSFASSHTFSDLDSVWMYVGYPGYTTIQADTFYQDQWAEFTWPTPVVSQDCTVVSLTLYAYDTGLNNMVSCTKYFTLREGSPPAYATLDSIQFYAWDCVGQAEEDGDRGDGWTHNILFTDRVLDGTTEVGCNTAVHVYGTLPDYQQYIQRVELWVQLVGSDDSTLVDGYTWDPSWTSRGATYDFEWQPGSSGYWRVWVIAYDDACTEQEGSTFDEFYVYSDCDIPRAWIDQVNGEPTQGETVPDTIEVEMYSAEHNPTYLWVDWADYLTPNDSTQMGTQIAVWAKPHHFPNDWDTYSQVWVRVDSVPSLCNPHFVIWFDSTFHCGDTLDVVVVAADRWGNVYGEGVCDPMNAFYAFQAGRYDIAIVHDTEPPVTQLWGIGSADDPRTDWVINQQTHSINIFGGTDVNVYLHAFSQVGDGSLDHVTFEWSLDGHSWEQIGIDYLGENPPACTTMVDPLPWWCDTDHPILWSQLWDISGLDGDVFVRVWGEDLCANVETPLYEYTVHIDATPPMAQVFVWYSDVNVDTVYCANWDEPQVPDSVNRFSTLTIGACPDLSTPWDIYGATWWMKRATDYPLGDSAWCFIGDDSTAPFSKRPVNFWDGSIGPCPYPQPGVWYDIAVLANDRMGNRMTWDRFLMFGNGMTYEEKWADLIARGFVKRFKVVDHTAPVAYDLTLWPDQTPDSSVIFLTGDVHMSATVSAPDVVAVTFGTREVGQTGPFTQIERVVGDSLLPPFQPVEGYWNTELMNGTYVVGAFAEDDIGNMDGNPDAGVPPQNTRTVCVDNARPWAGIDSVMQEGVRVYSLERGTEAVFYVSAGDNFGLRQVKLYYREAGSNPAVWTCIGTETAWPYTFHWTVPVTAVVGWTYDFAAVATDLVYLTDQTDGQGNYIIDWMGEITDNNARIVLYTIGGQDATTNPHLNGTNVELTAHFEPNLDNVRFVWVRGNDTTTIATIPVMIGDTSVTWDAWDVTALAEGPGMVGVIGSADLGGELVTVGYDYRNVFIDHTLPLSLGEHAPLSHGLLGGTCGAAEVGVNASVGFVLDYSGSMEGSLGDLEAAAHLFVSNMRSGDRGAVVKFDDEVHVMQGFTGYLDSVDAAIDVPCCGGATAFFDAIFQMATLITPETNRKVILAMTDGGDNSSENTVDDAIAAANAANAAVYTIGLGSVDDAILQQIADQTGGQYFYAPDASALAGIYQQIAGQVLVGVTSLEDLIVKFITPPSDDQIDTVWFEWKWTADPDLDQFYHAIGMATWDVLTEKWAYQWNALNIPSGLLSLRAIASDKSVPESNIAYIIFADSVRMDNTDPVVTITNINGDVTPDGMQIPKGDVINIVATAMDPFANGGNSDIVSVCFYYRPQGGNSWYYIGCPPAGPVWSVLFNTGGLDFGFYELQAVAFDEAGNCDTTGLTIQITDELYQRAYIVGYNRNDNYGCPDSLWAVTDDCDLNHTSRVRFQYSPDQGETWVSLGEDLTAEEFCNPLLQFHIWGIQLEFDNIPTDAIFRAMATDESGNDDPAPPVFTWNDVHNSSDIAVYAYDWVQVPALLEGQTPWVFSVLEDYSEECFADHELVCVNPVEGSPDMYAGQLTEDRTSPCRIQHSDGALTIFTAAYNSEDGHMNLWVFVPSPTPQAPTAALRVHQVDQYGGSNGWLTSESGQAQVYIPSRGIWPYGTIYFEPYLDAQVINLIPVNQPYYTLVSDVENIYASGSVEGFDCVPSQVKLKFNASGEWDPSQIVPVWWDPLGGMWSESGIEYAQVSQDGDQWFITFQCRIDSGGTAEEGDCYFTTFAVMMRETGFTIDGPYFADAYDGDWDYPDSCFYTPERGPTIGDDPAYWVVLRNGDGVPPEEWIDAWLDGIRIVHNGQVVEFDGCSDVFFTNYDQVSGIYKVYFNHSDFACLHSPWHCAMQAGPHTIRFRVYDGVGHSVETEAPFYVDVTGPDVYTWGRYICHNTTMVATITDPEACILIDSVWVDIWNAEHPDDVVFRYHSDVMTLTPVENGYQASFILTADDLDQLILGCRDVNELAVTWHAENTLTLENQENTFLYIVDIQPPTVVPVSPVGAPYDNDGDGIANEDPIDCINNDNDLWWDPYYEQWVDRIDEDWIDFLPDTLNFGERPVIQGSMNDQPICGSGASGVNLDFFHLFIDGTEFTKDDASPENPYNFTIVQPGRDDAFFTFGGTDNPALDPFYAPGEHRVSVVAGDSVCGNIAPYPFSWTYYIRVPGPSITFNPVNEGCGNWFDPEVTNEFSFRVQATGGCHIAINGIDYSVYVLPANTLINGPTVIDPAGSTDTTVAFTLSYPFQASDEGIRVHVTVRNYLYDSTMIGYTESDYTYAIDNAGPVISVVSPSNGEHFIWNSSVVAEATFDDAGRSGVKEALTAFTVYGPDGSVVADLEDLAENDAVHVKWVSARLTAPGTYTVNLTVGDCVGNLSVATWTFFLEPTPPAISFNDAPDGCGNWFDPEGANPFTFSVGSTDASSPVALNGISYRVLVLPDSNVIVGPQVVNPTSDPYPVTVQVAYPFQDADLGVWIEVTARCAVSGEGYGVMTSNHTYAIDNVAPVVNRVSPDSGQIFNRSQSVVIEATFSDDGGVVLVGRPGGSMDRNATLPLRAMRGDEEGSSLQSAATVFGGSVVGSSVQRPGTAHASRAALDDGGSGIERPGTPRAAGASVDEGGAHLDDVGSGIASATIRIIPPHGDAIVPGPEDPNLEVYDDHIKYTLLPTHIPGNYTVNVTVWDCIGNHATISWPFFVTPDAPSVTFATDEGECEYDGFWNPDQPVTVKATIGEVEGVNITRAGISLNIYRVYMTEQGAAEELLVPNVGYTLTPDPSDDNTAQQFTLMATPSLDPVDADIAMRFELVVADVYGTTATMSKTYQIDRVAPWIQFLSPAPLVAEGEHGTMVTIQAAYGDVPPPAVASAPGGDNGKRVGVSRMLTGAPQQSNSITPKVGRAVRGDAPTNSGKFGAWTSVVTGAMDELDGNSGIDLTTVRLWLRGPDGVTYHLEDSSSTMRDSQGITWTGLLTRGEYSVTLWVADRVCNEATMTWNFRIANGVCPTIAFVDPYYVSSMPHTFTMRVADMTGVDESSLALRIEKHQRVKTDSTDFEHYILLTDAAPVEVECNPTGDTCIVTYVANFYLENSDGIKDIDIRLTLCAADLDANLCCASQNYTVDLDRPVIDGVVPSPDNPLAIDSRPTFIVNFHEDGTGLNSAAITLATLGGVVIAGTDSVYISPTGSVGWVTFLPGEGLEVGQYMLRVTVTDVGGNVAMGEWIYRVGEKIPVLTGKKSYTWPNPFVPGDAAHFELGVAGDGMAFVRIKVYDFAGQYVATVYEGQYQPGQSIEWRGVNASGQEVANGVYLAHVVIEAGGKVSDEILKVAFKKEK